MILRSSPVVPGVILLCEFRLHFVSWNSFAFIISHVIPGIWKCGVCIRVGCAWDYETKLHPVLVKY